jgi:hypothetical protein
MSDVRPTMTMMMRECFMYGESVTTIAVKYGVSVAEVENAIRLQWINDKLNYLLFLEQLQRTLSQDAPKDAAMGTIQ